MSRPRKYNQYGFCVYKCLDKQGKLLYIGMTENLGRRMGHHKCSSCWFPRFHKVTWENCASRNSALQLEGQAITTDNPQFNKQNEGWQGIEAALARAKEVDERWQNDQPKLEAMLLEHPKIQAKLATYQTDH